MRGRLVSAVLLAAAIACTGDHRAGAQAFRANPGLGHVPGGIGGVGAVGGSGFGSGLNTGLGTGSGPNVNLGTSLGGTLPNPTPTPVITSTGHDDWGTPPPHDDGPSYDDDSLNRSTSPSPASIYVDHSSRDQDQDRRLTSSLDHPAVSAGGDPPTPPESGDDGGGDDEGDDDEDEAEGRGFPWLWAVLGLVALIVVFARQNGRR